MQWALMSQYLSDSNDLTILEWFMGDLYMAATNITLNLRLKHAYDTHKWLQSCLKLVRLEVSGENVGCRGECRYKVS